MADPFIALHVVVRQYDGLREESGTVNVMKSRLDREESKELYRAMRKVLDAAAEVKRAAETIEDEDAATTT